MALDIVKIVSGLWSFVAEGGLDVDPVHRTVLMGTDEILIRMFIAVITAFVLR